MFENKMQGKLNEKMFKEGMMREILEKINLRKV
jgi:hypothetical protein